jgi:hypothetical protein
MYGQGENEWSIPYETRKQWFNENPGSKWAKLDMDEINKPKSTRGRKPGQSKRVIGKKPDHYKWWRE